ncbi:hypothetical protein [Deinococcus betulae]|nr:hypothetical protein [Deinococcus betulae]
MAHPLKKVTRNGPRGLVIQPVGFILALPNKTRTDVLSVRAVMLA